ncbi:MAG: hypothetical protein COT84_00305 [Chlamydiae bacterium CG10_big_fil_rev_8_21_14_0_10_35_9]|nr:MAG: hypothetical protein COT84_00305 [Chlamydiae bacterium CG10_big_fil_rev_8_21_14_0_10_35_9]
MIKGLDIFKEYFTPFNRHYALIGGVASMLSMEEVGLDFRATRDLDIVLFVESLSAEFATVFWNFIKTGNYMSRKKSTGKKQFYRFQNPTLPTFPDIIELFSREPKKVFLREDCLFTPIPVNEEISSLSAILLNDEYYHFIHDGKILVDGISIVRPTHIIPLKAKAFLDLSSSAKEGKHVDSKDIRKHRNDIIRLHQLLSPKEHVFLPVSIRNDMKEFLSQITEESMDLKALGLKNTSLSDIIEIFNQIYSLIF